MTERETFHRAICDNPADDTARLVFADWLEEHGDAARGEFVRVEVLLSRRDPDDEREEARRSGLFAHRSELLKAHKQRWLEPFLGYAKESSFERGFVAELERLASHPDLSRLRELVLAWNALGSEGAEILAGMGQLRGLEELNLVGNGITSAGARALAQSPHLDAGPREGQRETVQARALLEKADRVRAKASDEDRDELDRLAGRVRDAMTDRRWSDLQSACNDLSDVLFYLEDA